MRGAEAGTFPPIPMAAESARIAAAHARATTTRQRPDLNRQCRPRGAPVRLATCACRKHTDVRAMLIRCEADSAGGSTG